MSKPISILILFFGILLVPQPYFAQKHPSESFDDQFQIFFYDALKQKSIENYDRATEALLKCIDIDSTQAVIYFELGKNYIKLDNFDFAEKALLQAVQIDSDNRWFLESLYQLYVLQNHHDKAISVLLKLGSIKPFYKDQLAALYIKTNRYDDALKILDQLDAAYGSTINRNKLRDQVYKETGSLETLTKSRHSPKENKSSQEIKYLDRIFHYSENNEKEKAFETARELQQINPKSSLVHLALYKFYLEDNAVQKAVESMEIILKSDEVNPQAKHLTFKDFVKFVHNKPQYEPDLSQVFSFISDSMDTTILRSLGDYYVSKNNKQQALYIFEKLFDLDPENFGVLSRALLLYVGLEQFDKAKEKSAQALESYPSQPLFYLVHGIALNALNEMQKAIESLEMGLDFIVEDPKMEIDILNQLSVAYTLMENPLKAKLFRDKAKQIEKLN